MRGLAGALSLALAAFAALPAAADGYRLFHWVELIGFDNASAGFGVAEYLGRMERKPDVISLLLDDDQLMLTHKPGSTDDFVFSPQNCSYGPVRSILSAAGRSGRRISSRETRGSDPCDTVDVIRSGIGGRQDLG